MCAARSDVKALLQNSSLDRTTIISIIGSFPLTEKDHLDAKESKDMELALRCTRPETAIEFFAEMSKPENRPLLREFSNPGSFPLSRVESILKYLVPETIVAIFRSSKDREAQMSKSAIDSVLPMFSRHDREQLFGPEMNAFLGRIEAQSTQKGLSRSTRVAIWDLLPTEHSLRTALVKMDYYHMGTNQFSRDWHFVCQNCDRLCSLERKMSWIWQDLRHRRWERQCVVCTGEEFGIVPLQPNWIIEAVRDSPLRVAVLDKFLRDCEARCWKRSNL